MSNITKVFLRPTGLHSKAMLRIADALEDRAPEGFQVVPTAEDADLVVLHVISPTEPPQNKRYAVIQYCGSHTPELYQTLWANSRLVWSYYDLRANLPEGTRFLLAPLGVDAVFTRSRRFGSRSLDIMTSGYSTGPYQEAIQETVTAVDRIGGSMVHLGPATIEGWEGAYPACWQNQFKINDETLALLYRNSKRVSALRHLEGFELPALEGLACGARPVMFDRPDARRWYDGLVEFVPECHGEELTAILTELLKTDPQPVSETEREHVLATFNWDRIAAMFWGALAGEQVTVMPQTKRRLLWIGDAGVATGFERSTRHLCNALNERFEVSVLGLNHTGDPVGYHPDRRPNGYDYDVYPCLPGGDFMGLGRTKWLVEHLEPAVVVVQNDPWHMREYLQRIGNIPTIGYVAIDGKHPAGSELNGLEKAIFWTKFAETEAKLNGYTGPSAVVPLGVDLGVYQPTPKLVARTRLGINVALTKRGLPENAFIVSVVARNQWRKRLDLVFEYFAKFIYDYKIDDACLWMHSAPTGDDAWDLADLAKYFKITDRVMLPTIPGRHGLTEEAMALVHSMADVHFSATLGEGFGLPMFEAMACGTPVVAPDWSALGDLLSGAAALVPCTSIAIHPKQTNTVGGVMDRDLAVAQLLALYRSPERCEFFANAGLRRVYEPRFQWTNIGDAFVREVEDTLRDHLLNNDDDQS